MLARLRGLCKLDLCKIQGLTDSSTVDFRWIEYRLSQSPFSSAQPLRMGYRSPVERVPGVVMLEQNPAKDVVSFLIRILEERKQSHPKYSLRALADEIGVNPGILSSVVAGSRKLTYETASHWLDQLKIDPLRRNTLLTQMAEGSQFENLSLEQSEKMGLMEYAIISVLEVRVSQLNLATLTDLLERTEADVRSGVERLQALGWVSLENDQVSLLKTQVPKCIYTMPKYESVISEAMAVIEKSRQQGTWLQGLSNTFSFVSSPEYIRDNYSKYMKAVESLQVSFEQKGGNTLYQGLCFVAPTGKKLR